MLPVSTTAFEEGTRARPDSGSGALQGQVVDSLTTGVIALSDEGIITVFNRAAEIVTGIKARDARGRFFDQIATEVAPGDHRLRFDRIRRLTKPLRLDVDREYDDRCAVAIRFEIGPVAKAGRLPSGFGIELRDITWLKRAEEQAYRKSRLSAMGEMALKIAHDIRNPLGSIELFASSLEEDLDELPELRSLAGHISSGVNSINAIVTNLLLFIRHDDSYSFNAVTLQKVLRESLFFSKHMLQSNNAITLNTRLDEVDVDVCGDAELLKQALLNMILNAIQAMPDGGTLTLSMERSRVDRVKVRIEDTGCGIPRGSLQKIFDPFYSTKKGGTGLGMSIVHNIISTHDGTVDVDSTAGKGTRFTITLPVMQKMGQGKNTTES